MTGVGFCSGKNDVEQDDVRRFFVEQIEAFLRVGGLNHLIRRLEDSLERGPDTGFIID